MYISDLNVFIELHIFNKDIKRYSLIIESTAEVFMYISQKGVDYEEIDINKILDKLKFNKHLQELLVIGMNLIGNGVIEHYWQLTMELELNKRIMSLEKNDYIIMSEIVYITKLLNCIKNLQPNLFLEYCYKFCELELYNKLFKEFKEIFNITLLDCTSPDFKLFNSKNNEKSNINIK